MLPRITITIILLLITPWAWSATGYLPRQAFDPQLRDTLMSAVAQSHSFEDRFAAEVWLVDMSLRLQKRIPQPEQRIQLLRLVHSEAARAGLPAELVLAVIDVESRFDRYAISNVGARGLMQIMPFWLQEIGRGDDNLFHTETNLRFGCTILSYYLRIERGNLSRALARYNGSLGSYVYVNQVLGALNQRWYRQ
jgi:soluble lytic murein transglycosylase-like protein